MRIHPGNVRAQPSFELLLTLAFGLVLLMPVVIIGFIQVANAGSSLSAAESQQAASKLTNVATLVGSEGAPAKQLVLVNIPGGVKYIYVGSTTYNGVGHEVVFVLVSPVGLSYVTSYSPVAISGNIMGLTASGSYLVNITAQAQCPSNALTPCVYMQPGP